MRYKKLKLSEVTQQMIDDCLETAFDTLCISKENNTFLKWSGNMPKSLYGVGEEITNIKKELQKDEWMTDGN